MSASIKSDLLLFKQNKTLKDYSILFLTDYYYRLGDIETPEDKAEILSGLSIGDNYTVQQMIDTILNLEYDHEEYLGACNVKIMLKTYHMMGEITNLEYLSYLDRL